MMSSCSGLLVVMFGILPPPEGLDLKACIVNAGASGTGQIKFTLTGTDANTEYDIKEIKKEGWPAPVAVEVPSQRTTLTKRTLVFKSPQIPGVGVGDTYTVVIKKGTGNDAVEISKTVTITACP